jgi:hypothetical protein
MVCSVAVTVSHPPLLKATVVSIKSDSLVKTFIIEENVPSLMVILENFAESRSRFVVGSRKGDGRKR